MKRSTLLLFTLFCTSLFAQRKQGQALIDSLEIELKNYNAQQAALNKTTLDKSDTLKVNILNALNWELQNRGNYEKAKQYANDALYIADKIDFKKGKASAYNNAGVIFKAQGNYPEALKSQLLALKINEEIGNKIGIANAYGNIGNIYKEQGNYPEALKNHLVYLKINEEIRNKIGIGIAYNNIGLVYHNQKNYPEALKNYWASLKIKEELGNKMGIANSYNNIGIVYAEQGNYPEALKNYFASLKISEEVSNKVGIANANGNIGNIYSEQGNYPEALKSQLVALKIREEIGDKGGIASSNLNIGNLNAKLKNYAESQQQLEKALSLAKEMGAKDMIVAAYDGLSTLDSAAGNWQKAFLHHQLYLIHRDSLLNEESTKKLTQTAMQYDFDKKQDSIKLDNQKRELALQKELGLKALQYEYEKKQAAAKSEQERQQLKFEQELKRQQIEADYAKKEADYAQKAALVQIEQSKKEAQNAAAMAFAQADIKRKNQERNYFLVGLALLASLLGFIIYGYFQKRKANKLLHAQKEEIHQKSEALTQSLEEIHQKSEALEQSLAELTATQNQLIQQEKLASLGELTAGIAHEIQNPLNFVNNFSELSVDIVKDLKEEMERPTIDKEYIDELFTDLVANQQKINHHGKRASSIVKGMLEHSRASTGVRELTDINKLADEYLRLTYHGLRAKDKDFNAHFELIVDEHLPKIAVIPQDFGRVLLNLIHNAFYAVSQKKQLLESYVPTVVVSTQKVGNQIIIKIRDNGTGIPESVRTKIFQPFFTTKPTGQGTGLGLSLAYDIVTKGHGGTLNVESTEGVGTEFIISLPA
jgi:two-component system, NtrC family, sensor kinase